MTIKQVMGNLTIKEVMGGLTVGGREDRPEAKLGPIVKLLVFLKLTTTDPFAAWCVMTGDTTPDGIRIVRSFLGAISSLPILAFRE